MARAEEFMLLPMREQWQVLVNRVPELESVKQDALRIWEDRGRPDKGPRNTADVKQVRSALRPVMRRAKKTLRKAVPDRNDLFRSGAVQDVLSSWIVAFASTGGDPNPFDAAEHFGRLPRWLTQKEGRWILVAADGRPVALIVLMNPDSKKPLPPGPDAKFHLVDRQTTNGRPEVFDNLAEAKASALRFLPPESDPPVEEE